MTDREMLELCRDAFVAIPVADTARRFVKKRLDLVTKPYGGTGGVILAAEMASRIVEHLKGPKP